MPRLFKRRTGLLLRVGLQIALVAGLLGCGDIGLGGGAGSNEAAPQGTIIKTGTFEGFGGTGVEGLVVVYVTSGSGTNIIRLESFSIDSTETLQLRAVVNGSDRLISTLRGTSGNFNYTTSMSGSQNTWTSVSLYSTAAQSSVATALLNF